MHVASGALPSAGASPLDSFALNIGNPDCDRRLPTPAPFAAKLPFIGLVERDYKGYDILTFRSTFWGVARSLGDIDLEQMPVERLNQLRAEGKCFIEQFTDEVKERIDRVPHP